MVWSQRAFFEDRPTEEIHVCVYSVNNREVPNSALSSVLCFRKTEVTETQARFPGGRGPWGTQNKSREKRAETETADGVSEHLTYPSRVGEGFQGEVVFDQPEEGEKGGHLV